MSAAFMLSFDGGECLPPWCDVSLLKGSGQVRVIRRHPAEFKKSFRFLRSVLKQQSDAQINIETGFCSL